MATPEVDPLERAALLLADPDPRVRALAADLCGTILALEALKGGIEAGARALEATAERAPELAPMLSTIAERMRSLPADCAAHVKERKDEMLRRLIGAMASIQPPGGTPS